jgi:hypothetical protein
MGLHDKPDEKPLFPPGMVYVGSLTGNVYRIAKTNRGGRAVPIHRTDPMYHRGELWRSLLTRHSTTRGPVNGMVLFEEETNSFKRITACGPYQEVG